MRSAPPWRTALATASRSNCWRSSWSRIGIGTSSPSALDLAVDRPLLAEPVGKRAKLGDGFGKLEVAVLAERHDEAADLALLLDEQALQFVEVGFDRRARSG